MAILPAKGLGLKLFFLLMICFLSTACGTEETTATEQTVATESPETEPTPTPPTLNLRMIEVEGSEDALMDGSFAPLSDELLAASGTQAARSFHQGGFGTDSRCGLDGEVVKVTNLNDSGPGSLRDAVALESPRTIVFEVSGIIPLESPLIIEHPYITIAGQTAPLPGISLNHSTLRIHTHDVCVQHIRVRHGDLTAQQQPVEDADIADSIIIRSHESRGENAYNVVLDNLSVSWSIDEAISIFGGVTDVTIRDSIIAEPLRFNAHNRNHAYCLLIRDDAQRISILGNVFAHCQRRNPRMDGGTLQYANNLVYNAGEYAVHAHDDDIDIAMVGNILEFPDNESDRWQSLGAREFFASRSQWARLYTQDNELPQDKVLHQAREQGQPADVQPMPTVWEGSVQVIDPQDLRQHITDWVGAYPHSRDDHDERVITGVNQGLGGYIDSQSQVGGYGFLEENYRPLNPPENPQGDDNNNGLSNLVEWLQSYTNSLE